MARGIPFKNSLTAKTGAVGGAWSLAHTHRWGRPERRNDFFTLPLHLVETCTGDSRRRREWS